MKFQVYLQHSEEDCGPACLNSIAKYYGRSFSINRIREAVGTSKQGTTLLGLKRGSEILGFYAQCVRAPSEQDYLDKVTLPAIIHWKGNHYVILYGRKKNQYVIGDPRVGIRYVSYEDLKDSWTDRIMLLLEADPVRFFTQPNDKVDGIRRFLPRLLQYRTILLQICLFAIVVGFLSLTSPFLIQILTDNVLVSGNISLLTSILLAVVVMKIFSSSLQAAEYILIAHFGQRLELDLILEFGHQILRLPLSYYESRSSGGVVSRLRDIEIINQLAAQVIFKLPSEIFIAIVSLCIMGFYSWKLAFLSIIINGIIAIFPLFSLPSLRIKFRNLLATQEENQSILVETFKGALTVKTTTAASPLWDDFISRFGYLANLSFSTIKIGIINKIFSDFTSDIGTVVLLGFGSSLVIAKELSIGQLLAFNSMSINFFSLTKTLIVFADDLIRVQATAERLSDIIDFSPEVKGDTAKPIVNILPIANITCANLSFNYPGEAELIENLNVTIPGGKITALIGRSGCGKSTLAKLIVGLYPVQSGNINIGFYNLQDVDLDCLRQQIVMVSQESHFWSKSVIENFRLAAPYATFEEIIEACEIANAHNFICRLPGHYHTILGEFGANLSGGQRQRLSLARGIVTNPPILILDEATAGLDPVGESEVLERLLSQRQGKTTILISHRPRVINRADWVVLLDKGKLEIQGSLEELYSKPGSHLDFLFP
ncbi:peptidase domain-containing ABC transporter [Nostoc sphaeroides]|uniref:Bacteriocin-processing peptidase n=1 Tax=Nostoc sphaeroides CCNUC1 TaxID=2653204 RepID=A0A5P8WKX3_9NOSO|nr:peptidase domain-containing ABC transporter [Nostoc sphaeroides]QFS52816.1 Bacteriocin-processing peptidase [Nostoc sphaeroides CCNUC1]